MIGDIWLRDRMGELPVLGSKGASFRWWMMSVILLIVPFLVANVSQRGKHYSNAFFRGNKIYQHFKISTDKELSPHDCWLSWRLVGYEVLNVLSFKMPEKRSRDLLPKYYGIMVLCLSSGLYWRRNPRRGIAGWYKKPHGKKYYLMPPTLMAPIIIQIPIEVK